MAKVSLSILAERLGLSKTLVSLVLNGKGDDNRINKETQERVMSMAKMLNYQPNRLAQSVLTGKTYIIGLIVPDISNSFFSLIAKTIENELYKSGYHLIVSSTNEEEKRETDLIETLLNWNIDGIIVASALQSPKLFEAIQKTGKPLVLIDRIFPGKEFLSVSVDNRAGSELMVKHLVERERRNILLLTISPSYISPIKERMIGFIEACKKYEKAITTFETKEISFENMQEEVKKIIHDISSKKIKADAIFTANNTLANASYKSMKELDMHKKMMLCSFDDISYFEHFQPPVSAIEQPVERIGLEATKLLLQKIDMKKPKSTQVVLPVKLIIR